MKDKQPAPVGGCHIVGKAIVPEDFGQLEAEAKHLQELMVSASMECAGKQQEALAEAMDSYLKVSTPSVMLSLLRQNAELKAERDALASELDKRPEPAVYEAEMNGFMSSVTKSHYEECKRYGVKTRVLYTAPPAPVPDEKDPRDSFERIFPMPNHVSRCGKGYYCSSYSAWAGNEFMQKWEGWKAHRAEVLKINSEFEGIIKSNSAKN